MFHPGTDGTDPCLVPVGGDHHLVVPEQPFSPFVFVGLPAVGIAEKLVDTGFHRVGDVRGLALDDRKRQAVHEQHNVRDDVLVGSFNLELVDAQVFVVVRVLEVNDFDRLTLPAFAKVLFHADVLDQCFP